MTRDEAKKIAQAINAVQEKGFGRIEIIIHEAEIIEVRVTKILKEKDITN